MKPTPSLSMEYEVETRNPDFSSLSSSLRVERVKGRGRSVISGTRLTPGTLVARERAAGSVLYIPKVKWKK